MSAIELEQSSRPFRGKGTHIVRVADAGIDGPERGCGEREAGESWGKDKWK